MLTNDDLMVAFTIDDICVQKGQARFAVKFTVRNADHGKAGKL